MKYFKHDKKACNAFLMPTESHGVLKAVPSPHGMKNSGSHSKFTVVIVTGYLCMCTLKCQHI